MKHKNPHTKQLQELMKWEVAKELGIQAPPDGYWGKVTAKDCGKIGSLLHKRAKDILLGPKKKTDQSKKSKKY